MESRVKLTRDAEEKQKEKSEYENVDFRALNHTVELKLDEHSFIMNRAIKFPEVKNTFMNTLLHEVLKYCKIDVRNLEVDELPMYYPEPELQSVVPEPQSVVLAIKESCPQINNPTCIQDKNNPVHLCSLLILRSYKRKDNFTEDNFKILIKMFILTAFGYENTKGKNKYFETKMTKKELLDTMKLFNTTTSIIDIILNENMEYEDKLNFIAEKIEQLTKENIQVQ
jgi:hypothetical protein